MPPESDLTLHHGLVRRLAASLRLVLFGGLLFIGVGAFLFFLITRAADERERALVAAELEHSAGTIADALRPVLRAATPGDVTVISEALQLYASSDRTLRLFFTPRDSAPGVFFIAGAPARVVAQAEESTARLVTTGALGNFSPACVPGRIDPAAGQRGGGFWAVVPVASPAGCWRLVANRTMAATAPSILMLPPIRSTGLAAAAAALLMFAAAILAMTQTRRLRQLSDLGQGFAEITAVPDTALLPQPANDENLPAETPAANVNEASGDISSAILDLKRTAVDLSGAVGVYAAAARTKLGADADRLQLEVDGGVLIDGREEYVRTILEDLVDPALRAPLTGRSIILSLRAEDLEGRGSALLMISLPPAVPGEEAAGRLSLIKQFVAALGAAAALETRSDGAETVRLRFPLSRCYIRTRTDVG